MRKTIHIQDDLRTNHRTEVSPATDIIGFNFVERVLKLTYANENFPDIWGRLGKRPERILEQTRILELDIEEN